ncbi:MAG: DUF4160 domain-containing protein [Candidatus Kapabacteria bacterium]|nr:DUF4160 domain-containing protein [Candidatus Kapabacteria bacterium]
MAWIVDAVYAHDYVVAVRDNGGHHALVDLADCLTGPLHACKDTSLFRLVRAATGTLVWPGGYDIDPDRVLERAIPDSDLAARVTLESADRSKILTSCEDSMPIISVFYGLIIRMYHDENRHHTAHLHASYAESEAVFDIATGEIITGQLPTSQRRLVQAWIELHSDELQANWQLLRAGEQPVRIRGLQ